MPPHRAAPRSSDGDARCCPGLRLGHIQPPGALMAKKRPGNRRSPVDRPTPSHTGFGQSKLRRLMRRTQSAVDAAAELMKFSTSPEITPKRRMAYGNLGASPHRVRHIDLRDQGRGDGAAPPAAKLARLGTRPLPPPPVWDRRSSSIDSVSTEVVGVSPRTEGTEGGLLPRRASPGGGAADEGVENFSPGNHPAAVRPRTRPIAPTPERASPPERLATSLPPFLADRRFGRPPAVLAAVGQEVHGDRTGRAIAVLGEPDAAARREARVRRGRAACMQRRRHRAAVGG